MGMTNGPMQGPDENQNQAKERLVDTSGSSVGGRDLGRAVRVDVGCTDRKGW